MQDTGDNDHTTHFHETLWAILFALIGWTGFVGTDTLSKWLTQTYSVSQVICLTSAVTVIVSGLWLLVAHGPRAFITPYFKWHMIRGAVVAGTAFSVVNALARIPMADFYGIVFLAPLILCVMAYFLLREPVGWHRLLAVVIGFGGVLVLAGPQFSHYNAGLLFALAGAFFVALNGIVVRKMRAETYLPLFAFYPSLFNMTLNAPFMFADFKMPAVADLPWFALVTPLVMIGLVCVSIAFKRAPETAVVAPFQYSQMIFGIMLGYVLFGDIPTAATLVGSAIIISSGLYVIWREHRLHVQSGFHGMRK